MIYKPRTAAQIACRAQQCEELLPVAAPVKRARTRPRMAATAAARPKLRKTTASVNKGTICANANCGHAYRDHCEGRAHHFPESWELMLHNLNDPRKIRTDWASRDDGWHQCVGLHCTSGVFENGAASFCGCSGFKNPYNGKVVQWKPEITESTPCARCHCIKAHHCRKSKTVTTSFTYVNGVPHVCEHYREWANGGMHGSPCCTSTSCCECNACTKFTSPFARPKRSKKAAIMGQMQPPAEPTEMLL